MGVDISECICLYTMYMVSWDVQVEKLMPDSIINLRGPSKSHKDKMISQVNQDSVSNIRYGTQYNVGETVRWTEYNDI